MTQHEIETLGTYAYCDMLIEELHKEKAEIISRAAHASEKNAMESYIHELRDCIRELVVHYPLHDDLESRSIELAAKPLRAAHASEQELDDMRTPNEHPAEPPDDRPQIWHVARLLDIIDTVKLASRGLIKEANAVGQARVMLGKWMVNNSDPNKPAHASESEIGTAYTTGVKMGKTAVEFDHISKEKWTEAYRHQIDELIAENETLRAAHASEKDDMKRLEAFIRQARIDLSKDDPIAAAQTLAAATRKDLPTEK